MNNGYALGKYLVDPEKAIHGIFQGGGQKAWFLPALHSLSLMPAHLTAKEGGNADFAGAKICPAIVDLVSPLNDQKLMLSHHKYLLPVINAAISMFSEFFRGDYLNNSGFPR